MAETLYLRVSENGETVFMGTAREIADEFDISCQTTVTACARKHRKLLWRYTVEIVEREVVEKHREPTLREQRLDFLYRHLKYYGNVYCKDDAEEFRNDLKEMGIEYKAVPCATFKDGFILWRANE